MKLRASLAILLLMAAQTSRGSAASQDCQNFLMQSIVDGRISGAETALANGANINATGSAGEQGLTPLGGAIVSGQKDMLIYLLKAGADPNTPDANGDTPLLVAARQNSLEIVEAIINPGGANLNVVGKDGKSAADVARELGNEELYHYLTSKQAIEDNKAGQTALKARPAPRAGAFGQGNGTCTVVAKSATVTATSLSPSTATEMLWDLGKKLNGGPLANAAGAGTAPAQPTPPKLTESHATLFPESLPADKPFFQSLRIDPAALTNVQGVKGRANLGLSTAELNELVSDWKRLGIRTLVVAHTERDNKFYYHPKRPYTYRTTPENSSVHPLDAPLFFGGALTDGTDFLSALMDAASRSGLKVQLGLSPPGDHALLDNLDKDGQSKNPDDALLQPDLDRAIAAAFEQAQDLYAQFGGKDSFAGWYLSPPALCAEEAARFFGPLGRKLKKLAAGKTVAVSLYADARICHGKGDLAALLSSQAEAISTVIYQDGVGTGRFADTLEGLTVIEDHFGAKTCKAQDCPDARIRQVGELLTALKAAHEKSKVPYQLEAQGWRRPGKCPTGYDAGYPNDCPQRSLPSSWNKDLLGQLQHEAKVADLVLADGFSLFDFGIDAATSLDFDTKNLAPKLTKDYLSYLGAPRPGTVPSTALATATGTSTATAVQALQDLTKMEESQVLCTVSGSIIFTKAEYVNLPEAQTTITPAPGANAWETSMVECPKFAEQVVLQACRNTASAHQIAYEYEMQITKRDGTVDTLKKFGSRKCQP